MHLLQRAALAAALVVAGVLPASALAITNGVPDGNTHPSVGLLVAAVDSTPICSGTLIGATTFVTAAHCVAGAGSASLAVQFDTGTVPASGYRFDPAFGKNASDPHDLAVVTLAWSPGIAPSLLAPVGSADRSLKGMSLTAVGYGYYDRVTGGGPPRFLYDGVRRSATAPVYSVQQDQIRVLSNANGTGQGGVCFGDSGGPWYLNGSVVGLTMGGDMACSGMSRVYRLDTPAARAFLALS
jgi:hypothetical protein